MKKVILVAAAALALAGCGEAASLRVAVQSGIGAAVDEKGLATAVDQAVDGKALGDAVKGAAAGAARGAVDQAVREAVPAEMRALGAVIDEEALAKGIDGAIDERALVKAVAGAAKGATAVR